MKSAAMHTGNAGTRPIFILHSWCRVVIFVVSFCMKISSADAICAMGQSSRMACVEPTSVVSQYSTDKCWQYSPLGGWGQWCVENGACSVCICSCLPADTNCPARGSPPFAEVCTECVDGQRGDGQTCTWCPVGTVSTMPISDSCVADGSTCPVTRSLACSGNCACVPFSTSFASVIAIADDPLIPETRDRGYYGNNWNCVFTMSSDHVMSLQFTMFITQRQDIVTIRKCTDASCASNTQLYSHGGFGNPKPVYSSDVANPVLQLTFTTDSSGFDRGWIADWKIGSRLAPLACDYSCGSAQYLNNNNLCVDCPANSMTQLARNKLTDCTCNTGTEGPDGRACTTCDAEVTNSPADCICNAGFSGVPGELCEHCGIGKFRAEH